MHHISIFSHAKTYFPIFIVWLSILNLAINFSTQIMASEMKFPMNHAFALSKSITKCMPASIHLQCHPSSHFVFTINTLICSHKWCGSLNSSYDLHSPSITRLIRSSPLPWSFGAKLSTHTSPPQRSVIPKSLTYSSPFAHGLSQLSISLTFTIKPYKTRAFPTCFQS